MVLALVRACSIVVLLWLAWDHRVDATYAWCAIVAFAASWDAWLAMSQLLFLIPNYFFAVWILPRLMGPGLRRTSRYVRALDLGFDLVRAGNRRLRELSERRRENPSWPERILALIQLGYVPLLVASAVVSASRIRHRRDVTHRGSVRFGTPVPIRTRGSSSAIFIAG